MARGASVRIEGLRELDAALGQLTRATGKNVLRRVGMARMEKIAERAAELAPELTQALEQSIVASSRQKTGRALKRTKEGKSSVNVYVGPTRDGVVQGIMQEFGTDHHPPQPFLRPAWDAGKEGLIDGLAEDLWSEVQKAAARQAKKAARLAKG